MMKKKLLINLATNSFLAFCSMFQSIIVRPLFMYCPHPEIVTPPDATTLWRYFDMERFLSLLSTRSLYLCRIDKFRDKWEGLWSQTLIDAVKTNWQPHTAQNFLNTSNALKKAHFVSCWHAADHESAALWDQYSGNSGIAIRSTTRRLLQSIAEGFRFYVGEVKYIDFPTEPIPSLNLFIPVFRKRRSFEHEREVRVLVSSIPQNGEDLDWEKTYESLLLSVKVEELIDTIFISPTAPEWLVPIVEDVLIRLAFPAYR
jgi:hypothetical protein